MTASHAVRPAPVPFKPLRTVTPCPACGCDEGIVVATRDGKTFAPLHTIECSGCGLGRIDPLPTQIELAQWYSAHYRQDYKGQFQPALRHVLRAARLAAQRWKWLQQHVRLPAGAPTLDVGASSGEFVSMGTTLGFASEGVEPNEGYAEFGRRELGVRVRTGTLEQHLSALPKAAYAVVSAFHVFEHTVDPVGFLRHLASLTQETGVVYIEVPDAAKPCAPHTMFFRAHTLYFTRESLPAVAARAGLRVQADNFAEGGELRVLLSRASGHAPVTPGGVGTLSQAQRARTWSRYTLQQLRTLAPLRKLIAREEEKRTARRAGCAAAILQRAREEVFPAG